MLDMTVHVARYGDMAPPDGRATLAPFADVEEAIELTLRRYADLAERQPELARNIRAANADDLRVWHRSGHLKAIRVGPETVGLLAAAPGAVEWIEGDELHEEAVMSAHAGHGYAASAQAAWAAAANPVGLMVGTIDRLNHASRRTATRAGRRALLTYGFVPIG
jgi:hypothetical protein